MFTRGYVLAAVALATWGVVSESPGPLVAAIVLCLPTSVVTIVGYYVAYGLLALVPGANPPSGARAPWFVVTTGALAVLAVATAAVLNLILVRMLVRRRRPPGPVDDDSRPVVPAC